MGNYKCSTSRPTLVRLDHEAADNDPTVHSISIQGDVPQWIQDALQEGHTYVMSYGFTEHVDAGEPAPLNMEVDPGAVPPGDPSLD